jgi:hypothetical protein
MFGKPKPKDRKPNGMPIYIGPPPPPMRSEFSTMFKLLKQAEEYNAQNEFEISNSILLLLDGYIQDYSKMTNNLKINIRQQTNIGEVLTTKYNGKNDR